MNEIENYIGTAVDYLQKLQGAPAIVLVALLGIVMGYILRFIKRFPNDGIPVAVVLFGGVVYPLIADANNELTLRVWLVRNVVIGLVCNFFAWLVHKKVLSPLEDKLGIGPKVNGTIITNTETKTT